MAHNPKLQVFRIELTPRFKTDTACFRDILTRKLNLATSQNEKSLWNSYWQDFVKQIDLEFFKDDKSKKAFTIYNEWNRDAISSSFNKKVLEGVIKGGKYDRERNKAKVGDKAKVERIDKDDIILDQFYFLLYTPLESTKGILILQTYTEETIYDVFSRFLIVFFRERHYFDLKIESFVPQKLQEEYKKSARLKGFSFTSRELIGKIGEDTKEKIEEFDVEIRISPRKETGISQIQELVKNFSLIRFNDKKLVKYSKRVYLADDKKKAAHYDIEKDIEHIKPTIYLENRIKIDKNTGFPDYEELKQYSFELLENINLEIIKNETINETTVLP